MGIFHDIHENKGLIPEKRYFGKALHLNIVIHQQAAHKHIL
jgi:hypothetical protein